MELKDFVNETIMQICQGVRDAQDTCKSMGAFVNPMLCVQQHNKIDRGFPEQSYPSTQILFNIGLTEASSEEKGSKIGVFLGNLSLGHENKNDSSLRSVTSISFSINAVLPCVAKDGCRIEHYPNK